MTLDALIMLAGSLVALLPFLGFPNSWDTVMFFFLGIFVVALGIVVRRRGWKQHPREPQQRASGFVESAPPIDRPSDDYGRTQ